MWCLERFWKHQAWVVVARRLDIQIFQRRKFSVYGQYQFLQKRRRKAKVDVAQSATPLESKQYSSFVFRSHFSIFVAIIDSERQRR